MLESTASLLGGADELAQALLHKIGARTARIGIVGLGYVGVPLLQCFADRDFATIGFDIDREKVEKLARGDSYLRHMDPETIRALSSNGRFQATSEPRTLGQADVMIVCVPTPLSRHREPDLSAVEGSCRMLAGVLRPGQLVVLESTSYPGTTDEVAKPILEQTGLVAGRDFFLAYSPEREDPGNAKYRTASIPKVVGADDDNSRQLAELLYGSVVSETVPVSNTRTAEAIKLTENIFRSVNIALVNELKTVYGAMGIDVWEVIDAASTKPFGFMPFYPGPGLGGHCIPIDPFYLSWKAREYEIATRFIELAGEINTAMPRHVVERVAAALDERRQRGMNGARVLLVGVAYKKNIADTRESPALRLIELLEERGASVDYHDPHVTTIPMTREHGRLAGRESVELRAPALRAYDIALICTDHDDVDYESLVDGCPIVVDTRNVLSRRNLLRDNVVKA